MLNVLVYALPNTSSGGLSVVRNLYEDVRSHREDYPDIHWFFITGVDGFENAENVTVFNEGWALKTYAHRLYFNAVRVSRFVREHDIACIVSLNMGVSFSRAPSIISLHNVLPLYRCGAEVFDRRSERLKQALINALIVKSLKRAACVVVPSRWIREALVSRFGVAEERIRVSPVILPEIEELSKRRSAKKREETPRAVTQFCYPATGFPYKNHALAVAAAKLLKREGLNDFEILFSGNVGDGKTIRALRAEIEAEGLPVSFCGLLSREQLVEQYEEGVLLFPSKIETDGFPLLESMACGGYILAADLPYAREALEGYERCDFFDPDDAEGLKELMKKAMRGGRGGSAPGKSAAVTPRSAVIVPVLRSIAEGKIGPEERESSR